MPTKKELEAVRLVREILMDPKVRRKLMKEMGERGLKEPYRSRFDPESPEYVEGLDPYSGFCSMASDALRRILGGEADRKFRGYQLCRVKHGPDDLGHFYLRTPRGEYLDPTASQFKTPVPYAKGRGVGLPTTVKYPGTDVQIPTQAAQVILDAARARRVASRYIAKRAGLLTSPRQASLGHLEAEEYEGIRGRKGHMTRWEQGEIPTSEALKISPPKGYHGRREWNVRDGKRYFGSYPEEKWNEFLDDVRRNGIKTRLWIQQDPGEEAQIMEGNHRVQAAAQLGLPTVPVTIKYYGLSEEEGLVAPRVRRTLTHQDPERMK